MDKKIAVGVLYGPTHELPKTLTGFAEWINRKLVSIPSEYVDSATVSFDYEDCDINIDISYFRHETKQDAARRKKQEAAELAKAFSYAEMKYLELKAKIEENTNAK